MKLLFDANLSPKLVSRLKDLFPHSLHIFDTGMPEGTPDESIWKYASGNGYTIVTADSDFVAIARQYGQPPKVIWLKGCDYPTRVAADLIRRSAVRLIDFEKSKRVVLVLRTGPGRARTHPPASSS